MRHVHLENYSEFEDPKVVAVFAEEHGRQNKKHDTADILQCSSIQFEKHCNLIGHVPTTEMNYSVKCPVTGAVIMHAYDPSTRKR